MVRETGRISIRKNLNTGTLTLLRDTAPGAEEMLNRSGATAPFAVPAEQMFACRTDKVITAHFLAAARAVLRDGRALLLLPDLSLDQQQERKNNNEDD
jgi:hypothetical protein